MITHDITLLIGAYILGVASMSTLIITLAEDKLLGVVSSVLVALSALAFVTHHTPAGFVLAITAAVPMFPRYHDWSEY